MQKAYQVTIEGRVFEGCDPRALLRKAVEVKRCLEGRRRCRHCDRLVHEPVLLPYELCFECVDQAVDRMVEKMVQRVQRRARVVDFRPANTLRPETSADDSLNEPRGEE